MQFSINESHLNRLCEVNSFPAPQDRMIFFGIRGCLPMNTSDHRFLQQNSFNLLEVNYMNPRCTIGQWRPADNTFAVFPGSTSPHINFYQNGNGAGANQLMPGYYVDYKKGVHKAGTPTGHDAFKQTDGCPVRRTYDDMDYDNYDDRVEYEHKLDNIHAGWCLSVNADRHAGAGCQVILGFPRCPRRDNAPDEGPWKVFKENAYRLDQERFPYVLLEGLHVLEIVQKTDQNTAISARLRFGSKGPLVRRVQTVLRDKGFYEGDIDEDFGSRTLRAVLAYQTQQFGPGEDNGVVGPITASALGVEWPRL